MNPPKIDLRAFTYQSQIVLVRFAFQSYLLYNSETNSYLYLDPHHGICFTDDNGNHFVCAGKFYKIKTHCEDITLECGQGVYVKSLNFYYQTLLWSEVYQKAVEYFTLFSESIK